MAQELQNLDDHEKMIVLVEKMENVVFLIQRLEKLFGDHEKRVLKTEMKLEKHGNLLTLFSGFFTLIGTFSAFVLTKLNITVGDK